MRELELLAPARNIEIGIAAIDCGADAVYLAGPSFGARHAAGNSVEDIRKLCLYAHRFGARVFVTLNTILFDSELPEAFSLAVQLQEAGVDALIVQDFALLCFEAEHPGQLDIPLHASTQCSIRSVEDARRADALGFSRIVLERELPLSTVMEICSAVSCEVEAFVHGALCVCYSGQCYLSEMLSGRSANRGECVQACRSRYDLVNGRGELVRWPSELSSAQGRGASSKGGRPVAADRTLLSLRDLNLLERLPQMADAGVDSFKIEGRLKNISYVRNIVAAYSQALDALVSSAPEKYRRASFGRMEYGFMPSPGKSFNRGFTELYFEGSRGSWACLDAGKALGEAVAVAGGVSRTKDGFRVSLRPLPGNGKSERHGLPKFSNGDGFSFIGSDGKEHGFRADVCNGDSLFCSRVEGLSPGMKLYRNLDTAFEKELEKGAVRRIQAVVDIAFTQVSSGKFRVEASALSEDGRKVEVTEIVETETARNRERMLSLVEGQLGKNAGDFIFALKESALVQDGEIPMLSSSQLNSLRRSLAEKLSEIPVKSRKINLSRVKTELPEELAFRGKITYKSDVANSLAEALYRRLGAESVEPAYELSHQKGAELMRSKYCILHELGFCRKTPRYAALAAANDIRDGLYLRNNGRMLSLDFDCARCEMMVR